jgi:hypothetical protein
VSCPLFAVLTAFVVSLTAHSAPTPTDPLLGTWKLNVGKSKYNPGPPPTSELMTYEAAQGHLKYTVKGVQADGSSINFSGSLIHDGKDYPATGTPDYDTVSTLRISPLSSERLARRAEWSPRL